MTAKVACGETWFDLFGDVIKQVNNDFTVSRAQSWALNYLMCLARECSKNYQSEDYLTEKLVKFLEWCADNEGLKLEGMAPKQMIEPFCLRILRQDPYDRFAKTVLQAIKEMV